VAVKVVDVLPNHNLVIEGRRETAFSSERQTIVLHGIIRPEDIASDDTVLSYNIADATISITGKGTVSDTQRKGWFTHAWDKVTPF
jgi:flagellar L-ring protein precursor FlgH